MTAVSNPLLTRLHAWRWGVTVSCAAIAFTCGATISAHEIGTTRVSARFNDGRTYDVEIVTDATALAEKLAATAGRALEADARPDRLHAIIAGSDENFRRRFTLTFDGTPVRPAISYAVSPAVGAGSAPAATMRLTGEIPTGDYEMRVLAIIGAVNYVVDSWSGSDPRPPLDDVIRVLSRVIMGAVGA